MQNLTLSMIVKNEEKYLQECLESVKDIVDEIVIVDTGSSDKTIEIAKSFNAKIFYFKWINDFSAARNYALKNSSGNWILYLDADERLSQDSIIELKKIILSNENLGVKCSVISLDDRKGISQSMKYTRLFRNNKSIKYSGKVHEQIENSLLENGYKIVESEIKIFHLGYNVSKDELKIKAKRNLELLLEEFNSNKTSYNSYQIANSFLILEDFLNSIKYYKKALEDSKLKNEFKEVCYLQLADFEMRNNNLFAAKNYIDKGVELNPKQSLINIIAAQIYAKMNDKKALNFCKNAFESNSERKLNFSKINEQEIYTDDKKLIYEGILISLQFKDKDSLNYFLNKLNEINIDETKYLNNIINNEFYKDEILDCNYFIDQNNINNYLKIFDFVKNNDLKLELYSNLYDRFFDNSKYINDFGAFLITINQINEAKIIFESAISKPEIEDSTIFYLASIYISSNEINKLEKLQIIINNKLLSSSNSYSKEKFKILAEKITPLLK